jgi:hypothetical protein
MDTPKTHTYMPFPSESRMPVIPASQRQTKEFYDEEQKTLQAVAEEILAKAGHGEIRVRVNPYDLFTILFGGRTTQDFSGGRKKPNRFGEFNPELADVDAEVKYVPGATIDLPMFVIRGIIAHEVGHIVLNHVGLLPKEMMKAQEVAADEFAAKVGEGEGFAYFFENISRELEYQELVRQGSDTHPSPKARVATIRAAMAELATPKQELAAHA